ncbi:MAG TPA: chemotaxis protein CheD [Candidatus Nitrosotalea sp.]|nr:chemotaxis protein CheD [Candidatus Nitrosotalea sp.]
MGELAITDDETDELKTFVGSCVAFCLFDVQAKVAAMAHVMLPRKTNNKSILVDDEIGKFADVAFAHMIDKMISKGADLKRIRAKIAGGATIFSHESETSLFNVGTRNISAIKQILKENGILIISEDIGENFGRWVKFNLNSAKMTIISNYKKTEKSI